MGTRGLLGFSHGDMLKTMYNHFDSYPDGLGADVVKWILAQKGDFAAAIEKFHTLKAVDENVPPTEGEKLALLRYFDPRVSLQTADDWYALLRDTQGNPQATLDAGFYVEYFEFGYDSLFCEWAYIIDLERQVLEVYKGFNNEEVTEGRWTKEIPQDPSTVAYDGSKYFGIRKVKEYTFSELTENPDVMDSLEKEFYPDDED